MSVRDSQWAMAALTLSLFVANLSNLVVLTALPRIVSDLRGTQGAYTWIITASMLTITVCTPIWGRMSDVLDRKRLIQACVAGYVLASVCAGLAGLIWIIIAARVAIGVCAAGIIVLMQSISVEITNPRDRAKWIGYRGAVMSVASISAPSLGGFVTQHFGWRCCFFISVPIAVASIALLQRTLRLPPHDRTITVQVDWLGAALLGGGIVLVMLYISVLGPGRGWFSPAAVGALLTGAAVLVGAILFEMRAARPMLPLELFRQRDVVMCALAGAGTGIALFGSAVFLAIYLQIGRGLSPQTAGLMALPEAAGTFLASLAASRLIARGGRYKSVLIAGGSMVTLGFAGLGTIGSTTPLAIIGVCVALVGAGLGAVSENLVLVVQTLAPRGAAGSSGALVSFFRMLGGVLCVAVLGAVLSSRVAHEVQARGLAHFDHELPKLATLPATARMILETAYAHGGAAVYWHCVPAGGLILLCAVLLRDRALEDHAPALKSRAKKR
jgi:MFS family permease